MLLASGALLYSAGCGEMRPGGVQTVRVDTLPSGAVRVVSRAPVDSGRWHLVQLRDIRPPSGAPGEVFRTEDLAVADDGSVLMVESDPVLVKHYDPSGEFVGPIGGTGGGPGEYRSARIAVRGDTVFIADPSQDRLLRFRLSDHAHLGTSPVGCCLTYFPLTLDTLGRVVGNLPFRRPEDGGRVGGWYRQSPGDAARDTLWHDAPALDPSATYSIVEGGRETGRIPVPFLPQLQWGVDPGGNLVVGSLDDYELRMTSTGLDTLQLFSRTFAAVEVTEAERKEFVEETVARDRRFVPESLLRASLDPGRIPATKAPIERIWVDRSGLRWIQVASAHRQPVLLDLFDGDGRWLDVVAVPTEGWPRHAWRPIAFGRDRVVVALERESGEPFLRMYEIDRR